MTWRMAKSLEVLRLQLNAAYPKRSKSSDGGIGNAEHSARSSDHNPDTDGVVKARDFTHDPKNGLDSEKLAEALRASRDPRIKYLISNRKICAGSDGPSPWAWRQYTGSNPHNHHCHISVKKAKKFYDDETPWQFVSPAKHMTGSSGDGMEYAGKLLDIPEELENTQTETPEYRPGASTEVADAPEGKDADDPPPTSKLVVAGRAVAGTATTVGAGGTLLSTIIDPASDVVEKTTTIVDKGTGAATVVKQAILVPKSGFWASALHVVSSPGFLATMLVLTILAWIGVWAWQKYHKVL